MKIIIPPNYHLGDIINILQKYKSANYVYCKQKEEKNKFYKYRINSNCDIVKFLLSKLPFKMKICDDSYEGMVVHPNWSQKIPNDTKTRVWIRLPYEKMINLNEKKSEHIACQFDLRSFPPWPKRIQETNIKLIHKFFGCKLINIGDRNFSFLKNKTNVSLEEKLDIISTARFYIGIDSGLSHMSLMTNTKTYIVHPENFCPWFFYPEGPIFLSEHSLKKSFFDLTPA